MASKNISLGLPYDDCSACCPAPVGNGDSDKLHYPEVYLDFLDDPKLPENGKLTFVVERRSFTENDKTGKCSYVYCLKALVSVQAKEAMPEKKQSGEILDAIHALVMKDSEDESGEY